MEVEIDIIDGAGVQRDDSGLKITRVARVTGLTGDKNQRLYAALTASGIPEYGEQHPSVSGIYVRNKSARAEGPQSARVTIEYRSPDPSGAGGGTGDEESYEFGSTVQDSETNLDVNGNLLKVYYLPKDAEAGSEEIEQVCTATVASPMTVLRIRRTETSSPEQKIYNYVGCVNSRPWRNNDAGLWLCRGITSTSNDGGETYIVSYEFQLSWKYEGWMATVVYEDSATGETPSDVTSPDLDTGQTKGNGVSVYPMYREIDFGGLGL